MTVLQGARVRLRDAEVGDVGQLVAIRAAPEVHRRWGGEDLAADVHEGLEAADLVIMAIELAGRVVGAIQWSEEGDPMYRHATVDIYLDPAVHGQGLGIDAVRTLVHHLFADVGHHRIVIDPAADNHPAIRCYAAVGFRAVGVMRQYERGLDGSWHDGLLMELLADDHGRLDQGGRPT